METSVENEVWRYIPGTNRKYQVSNAGRVRSFVSPGSSERLRVPRLLGGRIKVGSPSRSYVIKMGGKTVERMSNKLVAMVFGDVADCVITSDATTPEGTVLPEAKPHTRRDSTERSTSKDYKLVPVTSIPEGIRKSRNMMPAEIRVLDDFLNSKSNFSKVELHGWLLSSAQRELYRARKENEKKYGKIRIHTVATGKDAGIYLSRGEF